MTQRLTRILSIGSMVVGALLLVLLLNAVRAPQAQLLPAGNDDGRHLLVGAIRWDGAVNGGSQIGLDYNRVLSPAEFGDRLPFYAEVENPADQAQRRVKLDGRLQSVMEREIEAARDHADLDYWAFNAYAPNDILSRAFLNYLNSPQSDKPNFAFIVTAKFWRNPQFGRNGELFQLHIRKHMLHPKYQTVEQGRPIIYLFNHEADQSELIQQWGSLENYRTGLQEIWGEIVKRGRQRPYLVVMEFDIQTALKWKRLLEADAISTYTTGVDDGQSSTHRLYAYKTLAVNTHSYWELQRQTGAEMVPLINLGWNAKPFIVASPTVSWYPPVAGRDYAAMPSPAEAKMHVMAGLRWLQDYPEATPAHTALIYAWNEFGEGGSGLCPTLELKRRFDLIDRVGEAVRVMQ